MNWAKSSVNEVSHAAMFAGEELGFEGRVETYAEVITGERTIAGLRADYARVVDVVFEHGEVPL